MKPVKIKNIELKNYRQFVNEKIDFKLKAGKNVLVIQGRNGFGKSNIYNAINWCFFGIEEHLGKDDDGLPKCNTEVFKKLKQGASAETSVKLILDTESGPVSIERSVSTNKLKEGSFSEDEPDIKVFQLINQDWKRSPYPELFISKILPKNMRHFFFIDGEKLRELFKNINPKNIQDSIFDLSQITLLQNSIDHLSSFKTVLRKSVKNEPNLELYEEQLEKLQNKIVEKKKELDDLSNSRDDIYIKKRKLDEQIDKIDNEQLKKLEAQRIGLESAITNLEEKLRTVRAEYTSYLIKVAPSVFAKNAILFALEIITDHEKTGELPPKIQQTFIEELLKNNECICGVSLEHNVESKKKLESLLEKAKLSDLVNDAMQMKYTLNPLLRELEHMPDLINKYEMSITNSESEYEVKQKELAEVKNNIGSIDVDKIRGMQQTREKVSLLLKEQSSRIGRLSQEVKYEEEKYKEVEKLYNEELAKKNKYKSIKDKIEYCDRAIKELEKIKNKIMLEIKCETQKTTEEYFSKLITAKDFDRFEIKDDYDLVVEKDGFNAVRSLSAAETLCLGYSFMSALRKASSFLAPIVIDTPLAKIDKEYRINVAQWFKDALHDAQVILLVTDSEYTEGFRNTIKANVAQEFEIKHDKTTKTSEVVQYGN